MATFEANIGATFSIIDGFQAGGAADIELSDGETPGIGSDTFEVGDSLTINGGSSANFLGTIQIRDVTFVTYPTGMGSIGLAANVPDLDGFTFPSTIDVLDIDISLAFPICFGVGTLIATPTGEAAVETMQFGELVMTEDGRQVPVLWIGRQTIHKRFAPAERIAPCGSPQVRWDSAARRLIRRLKRHRAG